MQKIQIRKLLLSISFAIFAAVGAASVQAQDVTRGPVYQDKLVDLADVLGRIHSIRILCNGQSDQYWRTYMRNLLDLEAPSSGYLRSRMVESFNSAYTAEQAVHGDCTVDATRAEGRLSDRGRQLTESLANMAAGETP